MSFEMFYDGAVCIKWDGAWTLVHILAPGALCARACANKAEGKNTQRRIRVWTQTVNKTTQTFRCILCFLQDVSLYSTSVYTGCCMSTSVVPSYTRQNPYGGGGGEGQLDYACFEVSLKIFCRF